MRLTYHHIVEPTKSRAIRCSDQCAMKADIALNEVRNAIATRCGVTETLQCAHGVAWQTTLLSEYPCCSAFHNSTRQVKISDVICVQNRNTGRLVAHASKQSRAYKLLYRSLGGRTRDVEHFGNRRFRERGAGGNGTPQDLPLHLRAQRVDH